jgi:hypothetical protein
MKNRLWMLIKKIWSSPLAKILFLLNLCFYAFRALGWWRASHVAGDCSSVAQARVSEAVDCHFLFSTGFMIGGIFYVLPDMLNRLTVVPLVHSFSSLCNCSVFRVEMGGILLFSSLQAILVGYGIERLVRGKRKS